MQVDSGSRLLGPSEEGHRRSTKVRAKSRDHSEPANGLLVPRGICILQSHTSASLVFRGVTPQELCGLLIL